MKTRTLFLTLLASISILLITSGLAFADPITGCVKKSKGKLYNVQIGTEPAFPCNFLDEQITWSEEGPQGEPGTPGENGQAGQDGQDGTIIHQVHLEDDNVSACGSFPFPDINNPATFGWCPNNSRGNFVIPDPMITLDSVVIANLGDVPIPGGGIITCSVPFINLTVGSFPFRCNLSIPNGVPLNYVIINPPSTP